MSNRLAEMAGTALFWKIIQQGGVNLLYFVRLLVLARLLAPVDIGLVAIAMTGVALFNGLTDFGLQAALIQKEQITDRDYATAWTVGVLRAATVATAVFFTAPMVAGAFGEPRAVEILRVLALLPMLDAASSVRMAELIRTLRFRSVGIAKLADALANTTLCIALAPTLGVWALVVGTLAGPFVYAVLSYFLAPSRPRLLLDRDAAGSLITFGRWIFITGLATIGSAALFRAVISRQLGTAELGMYFLAAKLAFLPNEVATEVIGAVSFPVYARVQSNIAQASRAFRAVFTSTYLVLAPVFALIIVLAPSLVQHVLGAKWHGTESLIRLLAVVGFIGLIGDTAVPVLKGLGRPEKFALLEGGQSCLLVVSAWLFVGRFGLLGAGYAWCVAIGATVILSGVLLHRTLRLPFEGGAKRFGAIGVASIWGACVASYIQQAIPGATGLALAIGASGANAVALLWLLNRILALKLAADVTAAFPQAAPLLAKYHW
jgi:O-antigen/teichoic acid export membrane protein